jgi:hypothetical protein
VKKLYTSTYPGFGQPSSSFCASCRTIIISAATDSYYSTVVFEINVDTGVASMLAKNNYDLTQVVRAPVS